MASLQDVKYKLVAVKRTKQITRTMNMVASAKLRLTQKRVDPLRAYYERYTALVENLLSSVQGSVTHPLCMAHKQSRTACILVFAPDRGLCGAFVSNITTLVQKCIDSIQSHYTDIMLYPVGKKALEFCSRLPYTVHTARHTSMAQMSFEDIAAITNELQTMFVEEQVDSVHIVHGEFVSLLSQKAVSSVLYPLVFEQHSDTMQSNEKNVHEPSSSSQITLVEPDVVSVLARLIPAYARLMVYKAFLNTLVSEHAARMLAMNSATENCDELIGNLGLLYNKTRQAAVTRELMDIVGGAEALSG